MTRSGQKVEFGSFFTGQKNFGFKSGEVLRKLRIPKQLRGSSVVDNSKKRKARNTFSLCL